MGSYLPQILAANENAVPVIFSLERDGDILSTLEVRRAPFGGGWCWENVQNKARRNANPSQTAQSAATATIGALNALPGSQVEDYLEALTQAREQDRTLRILQGWGANRFLARTPQAILDLHRELLPKALRDLDARGWLDRVTARCPEDQGILAWTAQHLAEGLEASIGQRFTWEETYAPVTATRDWKSRGSHMAPPVLTEKLSRPAVLLAHVARGLGITAIEVESDCDDFTPEFSHGFEDASGPIDTSAVTAAFAHITLGGAVYLRMGRFVARR